MKTVLAYVNIQNFSNVHSWLPEMACVTVVHQSIVASCQSAHQCESVAVIGRKCRTVAQAAHPMVMHTQSRRCGHDGLVSILVTGAMNTMDRQPNENFLGQRLAYLARCTTQ